jgi:hypothetical protein
VYSGWTLPRFLLYRPQPHGFGAFGGGHFIRGRFGCNCCGIRDISATGLDEDIVYHASLRGK